jgi:formate-dependent nitrite reductase membrane component NrfD
VSEVRSYHGQPVIKEPVWSWEIPCYLFTGGLGGASAGLAYLSGLRGDDVLARRAWAAATVGIAISPGLLISDLGKPTRFFNMLRMFKVTSPMSVGSWILSASGATTTLAAANAWFGVFPRLAKVARPGAALLGLPLSTYTAALLSNTAVPAWHEARKLMPLVFGSGAGLSAGAAAVMATPSRAAAPARRLALIGSVAELATKELMERRLGDTGEAYKQGAAGKFGHLGQGCLVAGSALLALRGSRSRVAAAAAGGLLLAGALSARWSVFNAGFNSVADPAYVVAPQRERIDRGERAGAARTRARVTAADVSVASPATSS